ncbi:MG2 domain-containing protein [Flavicella sp.]|uniref:alpha-2-macroglobulin family protein n=1 Tax=Flavicella sp. TaxID=2957742 RepID=UPI003017B2DE
MIKKLTYALLLLFVMACGDKTPVKTPTSNFEEFIYNTTQGVVSKGSQVKIFMVKDINIFEVGSELPTDILELSPKVKGKWVLKTKKLLMFTPTETLLSNTKYTCNLQLDKLISDVGSDYKNFSFSFKTITPNFLIKTKETQSYSQSLQYIKGEIQSADVITLEEAKTLVSAIQNEKKLTINWQGDLDYKSTHFVFVIDSIERYLEDSEIEVKWNGVGIGVSDNKGSSKIKIFGKNNFSVINIYVKQFPEQHVCINFSDPLEKGQIFKGLVTINGENKVKYIVEGNLLKVYPSKRVEGKVKLIAFTGIKNENGYKLKENYSESLVFDKLKPEVRLITNGLILPDSKNLKFNFKAVNLKAVDINIIKLYATNILSLLQGSELTTSHRSNLRSAGRSIIRKTIPLVQNDMENDGVWRNYAIDLDSLLRTDQGAVYRVELSIRKNYSLYSCEEGLLKVDYTIPKRDPINQINELETQETYWDGEGYYLAHYYDYNWLDKDDPCTNSYYYYNWVGANILASNVGVIVKNGLENTYFFAVTDILTTQVIENAHVELYNYQKQLIISSDTNVDGIVTITANAKASFAIVSAGASKTYVKLNEGNSLSLSKFNVGGKKTRKGLKGYLYGERGVWRPGDTIHTFFVLNDANNPLPKAHPIKIQVRDPQGKLKYQKIVNKGVNSFFRFDIPIATTDITGNWTAKVMVGGSVFHKELKIETVKPNRLKIKIDFKDELLSVRKPIQGDIEVKWLHGAIAKNLKTEVKMKISASSNGFENFPNYTFKDPIKEFLTEELIVFEGKVDVLGKAKINKKINLKNAAPGKLRATFLTRVFENGGDFSFDVMTKEISPFVSLVGLKSPASKRYGNSYVTDKNIEFSVATVDDTGTPIARKKLIVKVYEINWSWWWSSNSDNLARYVNTEHRYLFREFEISTSSRGTGLVNINIPNDKNGRYLIRITDPVSGHSTGRTAYFFRDWRSNSSGGNSESATMLVFNSDKEMYKVGDVAEITFPSGTEGNALVSIENGSKVLETQWVKTKKGQTTAKFTITPEMAPNVFVNISLLQPHASVANDLPLRLYGVIPIVVVDANSKLKPKISMPNELKPETIYEVEVSEENGKRMTYTLAVVEEGLLDLTRFKTPDLWSVFYSREALGVRTWDVFDHIIGAFAGAISQVFAIGGDEEGEDKEPTKANRFKPVVTVLGPFVLQAGATKTHQLKMPNYIGSVRTMVVAGDNMTEAYGKVEKTIPVRKSLMLLASLPRKLSPKEKVTLPVTVFAMENSIKNVEVRLKVSDGIEIIGQYKKIVRFQEPEEKMVYFDLEVKEGQGIEHIQVIAKYNGETTTQEIEIDVVNPNPITSKFIDLEVEANKEVKADFSCIGEKGTNIVQLEISTLPPMNFAKRLDYLIRYPHGCVEQTTSSVFPQLFLADIFDLTGDRKFDIKKNIENGIQRLGDFQLPTGGLSYWLGGTSSSDWGTSYAGHFMIEAQKKGFSLPLAFMSNWLRYQKQAVRAWGANYSSWNSGMTQAYRLYTLALAGEADLAAMNRLREFSKISNVSKWRLAAAYALAGQKEAASELMQLATIDFDQNKKDYSTYGSSYRNRAMAMETMLLMQDKQSREMAKVIAKKLSSDTWMSTQTTAYCLLSMAKMVALNGGKELNVTYSINGKLETINTPSTIAQRTLEIKETEINKFSIQNNIGNLAFIRIVNSGVLPLGNELVAQRNFKLYVKYVDSKGNRLSFEKLTQGTDFVAMVTLTNTNKEKVNDIAVTQIFPSGWEIVNTRFTDYGGATDNQFDYTDIRDDRVNFYFSMEKNEVKTFTVRLNAAYLGKYYLPGVQAEAMYDYDYFSRTKGQWIQVVK